MIKLRIMSTINTIRKEQNRYLNRAFILNYEILQALKILWITLQLIELLSFSFIYGILKTEY